MKYLNKENTSTEASISPFYATLDTIFKVGGDEKKFTFFNTGKGLIVCRVGDYNRWSDNLPWFKMYDECSKELIKEFGSFTIMKQGWLPENKKA